MRRFLLSSILLVACRHKAPPADAPLPVATVTTAHATLDAAGIVDELAGSVRAKHSAIVAPMTTGTVLAVSFSVGSHVRAGDVLVRLSAPEIAARVAQARAAFDQATDEHARAERLRKDNALSAAQYDATASRLRIAAAARDEADSVAAHAILRAPFSGVITAKSVSVGDTVSPGQALFVLEEPGALRFEAAVPDDVARRIAPEQAVAVRLDGANDELAATVVEVAPTADATSRTVLVKVDLPSSLQARSGAFGRLLLPAAAAHRLVVPSGALERRGQLEDVYVVEDDVARRRLVRTGEEHGGVTQVLSGLAAGDEVVVLPRTTMRDGQPVRRAR